MKVTVHPSSLKGIIHAPPSKSSMQRACAAALLRIGESHIHNPGKSEDDKAALRIIQSLGATVMTDQDYLTIISKGIRRKSNIDCGESGLSLRMFTPIAALSKKAIALNGSGSLLKRPTEFFDEVLPALGVKVKSFGGKLPIIVNGPLQPANIEVDGSLSSQFITGLLMAYSVSGAENVSIKVKDLTSKPYIDLTLDVMTKFGMRVPENRDYKEFVFHHNIDTETGILEYTVEADWSGAAFLLVAGAIAGPLTITGLDLMSKQGDKAIIDALMLANAGIAIEAKGIKVHPSPMSGFEFDATDCPDLFPPLAALAAYCEGITSIKGVGRLIHKESNRAMTIKEEFGKMNIEIDLRGDTMYITGSKKVKAATVHSRHDHRIAMACAVVALKADGNTIIENADAVKKSYPDFFNDLKTLGADVSLPSYRP